MTKHLLLRLAALLLAGALAFGMTGCSPNPPESPSGFGVEASSEGIVLQWQANANTDHYRLYRKQAGESEFKFIQDLTATEYTDHTTAAGVTYRYKLTALNEQGESAGTESGDILCPSAIQPQTLALSPPTITSVTKMDPYTNVVLFESANDTCEYEVLRADRADGEFISLGVTDETAFYDVSDRAGDWYYAVRAVRNGQQSDLSAPAVVGTNAKEVFGVPVLMYHQFLDETNEEQRSLAGEYSIWNSEFEEDLIWLRDNGYTTITTAELISYMNGDAQPPEKPVILTIDDGWRGVYLNAWPLLQKYNMKAVLAVIGEYMDIATSSPEQDSRVAKHYCTWDELKAMSDSGTIEIISHTFYMHREPSEDSARYGAALIEGENTDHFFLAAFPDYQKMNSRYQEFIGTAPYAMAYPYSKRGVSSDRVWMQCGYQILYSGNSDQDRAGKINYYVAGAGVTRDSAVTRRIARMAGTSAEDYLWYALSP